MYVRSHSLYRLVADVWRSTLEPLGFRQVKPSRWVRSTKAPIREFIGLAPPSYWGSTPYWGLNLDFVPVAWWREDYKLRWPAGEAEPLFSFIFHPIDYEWREKEQRWSVCARAGRERVQADAARVLPHARADALGLFDGITSLSDLPLWYERKRTMPRPRYGKHATGELHPLERIAYAFVLAKLGRRDAGHAWLERFIAGEQLMPRRVRRQLRILYDEVRPGDTCTGVR